MRNSVALRGFVFAAALVCAVGADTTVACAANELKIGILTDMTGPFADIDGQGSVEAAKLAVDDTGGAVIGRKIVVISGDHGNDPERSAAMARDWYGGGVSAIFDLASSGAAIAAQAVAKDRDRIIVVTGAGSSDLTGPFCAPTAFHWVYDTDALARAAVAGGFAEGATNWFFITADYAFGRSLERDATEQLGRGGGRVAGHALHPLGETDFGQTLLAAKSSGAPVIALADAGRDTERVIEQAAAYHLAPEQHLVALLLFDTDIHDIGLDLAQGLTLTTGWYWDRTDGTRTLAKRFAARMGRPPTMAQAGVYSAVLHYLHAVTAVGSDDASRVAATMRATPVHDAFAEDGHVRADGLMVHDLYAARVVSPRESRAAWDYLRILRTIPAAEAFRPLSESACPLVRGG